MSSQHEVPEGGAVPVVDAAPGDTAPAAATEISAIGKLGVPVFIAPLHQHQQRDCAASGMMAGTAPFQGFLVLQEEEKDDPVRQRKKWFKEMRGWLMVLATVAASVTYQIGLNPPGGFSDNGDPVLREVHRGRYLTFYYFNATAFVTSLVIMVLLMSERFYRTEAKVVTLMLTTFVDLASLVGAYIAGSTRYMSSCVYIFVITCVAFVCVIYLGEGMTEICVFVMRKVGCMRNLEKQHWFPVPADVVRRASPEGEAEERRRAAEELRRASAAEAKSKRRPFCPCCAPSATSEV